METAQDDPRREEGSEGGSFSKEPRCGIDGSWWWGKGTGTSDLRLGWAATQGTVWGQPMYPFLPCPPPLLQMPRGSKTGLWLKGAGFMAGGDTTGDLSLGHSQHHLLRHLPA